MLTGTGRPAWDGPAATNGLLVVWPRTALREQRGQVADS